MNEEVFAVNKKVFLHIKAAAEVTGLSAYFLRRGCRDGSVPHIRAGRTYLINLPALLQRLNNMSEEAKV